jgi:hypothetical protein
MRTIIVRIEIEDSDFFDNQLHSKLDGLLGGSLKSYKKVLFNKDLYNTDTHFKKLCKSVKNAQDQRDDYYLNKAKN